jgi:hypothetical protein
MKKILFFLFFPILLTAQNEVVKTWNKQQFVNFLDKEEGVFFKHDTLIKSSLYYATLAGEGQSFTLHHQQPLNNYFKLGLSVHKFSQEGVYNRSLAKIHDVDWGVSFMNKSETYRFQSLFSYQKVAQEENGGLLTQDLSTTDDPILYPIRLADAQTFARKRKLNIQHEYDLHPNWKLMHNWERTKKSKTYTDNAPSADYYSHFFVDSIQTKDSLYQERDFHALGFQMGSFRVQYALLQEKKSTFFSDTSRLFHGIQFHFKANRAHLMAQYLEEEQYHIQLNIKSKKFNFKLSAHQILPLFYHQNYFSNHFVWSNGFEKLQQERLHVILPWKGYDLSLLASRLQNYLYLDQNIQWRQNQDALYRFTPMFSKSWKWGVLSATHFLRYHWVSDQDVLRFPSYHFTNELTLNRSFFEGSLLASLGFSLEYFEKYYALSYSPVLAEMHLQDEVLVGQYPLANVFLNFKIQTADIRLQMRNLFDLWEDDFQYVIPDYPYKPMAIELGVKWELQ